MIVSAKVRAARKAQQKDRIKNKSKKGYPEFYANLPQQRVKSNENKQISADREEVKNTFEALQIAEITGDGLLAAQEKHTVAKLVLEKHLAAKQPNAQLVLTATGA